MPPPPCHALRLLRGKALLRVVAEAVAAEAGVAAVAEAGVAQAAAQATAHELSGTGEWLVPVRMAPGQWPTITAQRAVAEPCRSLLRMAKRHRRLKWSQPPPIWSRRRARPRVLIASQIVVAAVLAAILTGVMIQATWEQEGRGQAPEWTAVAPLRMRVAVLVAWVVEGLGAVEGLAAVEGMGAVEGLGVMSLVVFKSSGGMRFC